MKKTVAILTAAVCAGSMSASADFVVAGWDTFSGSGAGGAVSAPVTATDVTGSFVSTAEQQSWNATDERGASDDGIWGNDATVTPAASTIVNADNENLTLNNAATGGTLTFTIVNGGTSDIVLKAFHFDAYAFRPKAPRAYELSVLAGGGITADVIYTSADDEITHVGGAWANNAHDDIDHSLAGLADHTLAAGESVDFLLAFSSGVGDAAGGHHLFVDNIAVSAIPEPGTLGLFVISAGGLFLFRRRK